MKIDGNLKLLMAAFQQAGFEARIVGGAVRDSLIGIEPKDIDLCTDAKPTEIVGIGISEGFGIIPTGLQHGTVTLIVGDQPFEVTTLRIDNNPDGRHADVEYTSSFKLDAARRDLTINAMSMDEEGNVYDYFGGIDDLHNCRIRFVGNPDQRVKEDYLRILRFFRFAARFGFITKDDPQVKAITKSKHLTKLSDTISAERYWLEMQKLIVCSGALDTLNVMAETGVLDAIGLTAPCGDTFGLDCITGLSTMVKPDTIDQFLARWKLSNEEKSKLIFLVDGPPIQTNLDAQSLLLDGASRDWVISKALKYQHLNVAYYARNYIIPEFPIRGQDLVDIGVGPGPRIGQILSNLKYIWKNAILCGRKISREDLLNEVQLNVCKQL